MVGHAFSLPTPACGRFFLSFRLALAQKQRRHAEHGYTAKQQHQHECSQHLHAHVAVLEFAKHHYAPQRRHDRRSLSQPEAHACKAKRGCGKRNSARIWFPRIKWTCTMSKHLIGFVKASLEM